MDECGIKFCLCLGDIQSGGAWGTKGLEMADWEGIEKDFEPIRDRTLMIPGNHDGAYGKADINGDGEISGTTDYYIYNLTPAEVYDLVLRKVGLINGVTFDDSYNGYYVDDTVAKVRYILVNTHYSDGATNEDGTAVNNYMRKIRVGQPQMDMVINALQNVPTEDWHVVVGMHIPLAEVGDSGPSSDMVLLRDTLEAYQNRVAYTNTFGTAGAYDYISVDVDFSSVKGRVAGVFCGHIHQDDVNTDYAFPVITSMSDQTSTAKIDGVVVSGEVGTVSEQSFDVFTVNKRDDAIYATKIGYGSDRVFSIGSAYVVTLSLDGASASNDDVLVQKDGSYTNTITVKNGYVIDSVIVTMGGVDVTAAAYADGVITIDNVTGDIVITVTSTVLYTNLADPTSSDWLENSAYNAGVIEEWSNDYRTTNYIPVTQYDILRWKGLDMETSAAGAPLLVLYDENKTFINSLSLLDGGTNTIFPVMTTDENGVTSYEILMRGSTGAQFVYNDYCTRVKYVRFRCHNGTPVEDIIITVNKEIYPSEDSAETCSVTLSLDGASATNEDALVLKDGSYTNTLTANAGYEIDTVTVTMGGADVTAVAYADGVITIDNVTGDIVITVTSTVLYTNLADPTSSDWHNAAYLSSGTVIVASDGLGDQIVTNFIPVTQYDILRWKGLDNERIQITGPGIAMYDENKEYIGFQNINAAGTNNTISSVITTDTNGVSSYEILIRGSTGEQFVYNNWCTRTKYIRFTCCPLTTAEDIIITVNEEIV